MNKILPEHSSQKVNNILLDKWGISLFKFAQVFAVSPVEQFLQSTDYPFSHQEIRAIKRNLIKMRDDLLKRGRFILNITGRLWESPIKKMSDKELIKYMGLERFFEEYIHNHEIGMRLAEKTHLQGKRGSGINKKSIIAAGWGNLVSCRSRRIDWETLGDLYDWFWERVAPYKFYNKLKATYGIADDLRLQYNRHRWVGGAGNYAQKSRIKIREIPQFLNNLILHQFLGDKENYFKDKLQLTRAKFPRFFLNIFIDYYLAGTEGLTIFSRDQSLADPGFLWLSIWLQKDVGKNNFPNLNKKVPFWLKLPKQGEMPYKTSEIGDYFNRAVELFLEHKVNPTPLIIFPDKSYFSTSF